MVKSSDVAPDDFVELERLQDKTQIPDGVAQYEKVGDVAHDENEEPVPGATAYDFAIVVPQVSSKYMDEIVANLERAGFVMDLFNSKALQGDEAVLFCRVGVPLARLNEYAAAIGAPARLDPRRLREACARLSPPITFRERASGGQSLGELSEAEGLWPPFLHIFAPVRVEKLADDLYLPFVSHNRHKLLLRLFTASNALPEVLGEPSPARGAGLSAREMDKCHPFTKYKVETKGARAGEGPRVATLMVLHDPIGDRGSLRWKLINEFLGDTNAKRVSPPVPWRMPIHELRAYLGDQMGFYFLFLSCFMQHCLYVGAVGAAFAIAILCVENEHTKEVIACVLAPVILLGLGGFLEHFRQQQSTFAKEWGCYAWTSGKPRVRPEFKGQAVIDPVNGQIVYDFPKAKRTPRTVAAWCVIGVLTVAVLATISFIFWLKSFSIQLNSDCQPKNQFLYDYGGYIATLINIVQKDVGNTLYGTAAVRLTVHENWKCDNEHSDNLIAKLCIFKFFNTFAPIVYTAFLMSEMASSLDVACIDDGVRELFGPCGKPTFSDSTTCFAVLHDQVMILFISGAFVALVVAGIIPELKQRRIYRKLAKLGGVGGEAGASRDEVQRAACRRQFSTMLEYDNIEGPIDDYMEVALMFGYLAGFGAAFPWSSLIGCALAAIQIKLDTAKLLRFTRRPVPMEVRGIGVWERIFAVILYVSVFSTAGIICVTTDVLGSWATMPRMLAFGVLVATLLCLLKLIELAVPTQSAAVALQLKRQTLYTNRVVLDMQVDPTPHEAPDEPDDDRRTHALLNAEHAAV